MSDDENQIFATEQFYDRAISDDELVDIEALCSIVPGSRLYEVITSPIDSAFDEG